MDMSTNWLTVPPEISLTVRAAEPVSPYQVGLLEQFLAKETGRPYRLLFMVSPVEEVTSDSAEGEAP